MYKSISSNKEATNSNDQLYARGLAKRSNNEIVKVAKEVLDDSFDYAKYKHFDFDNTLIA